MIQRSLHFIQEIGNWRGLYLDFLHCLLPSNCSDIMKIKRKLRHSVFEEGLLFRRGFNQTPLRCMATDEVTRVYKKVNSDDCDEHQGGSRLFENLIHLGYYQSTMEASISSVARMCKHASSVVTESIFQQLNRMSMPSPFHHLGLQPIGPINPPSQGHICTLAATDVILSGSRQQLQSEPTELRQSILLLVMLFVGLASENSCSLIMALPSSMHLCVDCLEIMMLIMSNRALSTLRGMASQRPLTKSCFVFSTRWSRMNLSNGMIFFVLYYVHIVSQSATQAMPVIDFVDVMIPPATLELASKLSNSNDRTYDMETFNDRRHDIQNKQMSYQQKITQAYNKKVIDRALCVVT